MKFLAEINVMPHSALLDPQGKAVTAGLQHMGMDTINNVRIGKHITLEIEADDETSAKEKVDESCKKLLANLIMESYNYTLKAV